MRFANPHALWLLFAVPAAVLGYGLAFAARRRRLARLGDEPLVAKMAATVSMPRKLFRAALAVLALGLVALALARPQAGGRARLTKDRGIDLVVAFDFSRSMLAKDVYPSRLERAKRELDQLLDGLAGDRVGVVAFAGETLSYPPTTDYAAVKLFWRDHAWAGDPAADGRRGHGQRAARGRRPGLQAGGEDLHGRRRLPLRRADSGV